jgi:hypothetical protein
MRDPFPASLANVPRTPDGQQILIYPTIPPEERKSILNAMARDASRSEAVESLARFVVDTLRRQGRWTPESIAQGIIEVVPMVVEYHPDEQSHLDFYQPVALTIRPHAGNPVSPLTGRPKGRGDCEDMAVVFAAIALAVPHVGGPQMGGEVEWMPQDGLPQNHVTSIATAPASIYANQLTQAASTLPSGWAWAETTIPGARIGEHPYAALARVGTHATRITG